MNMETTTVTFFLMITRNGVFFLTFDGWLMFDGLQYTCLFDVVATEVQRYMEITAKSEIPVCNQ